LIEDQNATDFKVPLSVTKPRETKDKNGNSAEISDVAINTDFFKQKIKLGDGLFYHFLITLIFESIEQKYKIEIDTTNFVLMRNRLCFDKLVEHQIYNRDVKAVEKFHAAQDENELLGADGSEGITMSTDQPQQGGKKKLIEEIKTNPYLPIRKSVSKDNMKEPEHMLFVDHDEFNRKKFIAEFYLPDVMDMSELSVEANDDRLIVQSEKRGYNFEGFLPQIINEKKTDAEFDNDRMVRGG
jgi:hypothetical protein